MLHIFASTPVRFGVARFAVTSFSVVAHAGLITLAAVGSGRISSLGSVETHTIPAEHLIFVPVRAVATPTQPSAGAIVRAARNVVRLVVPDMTKLQVVADASMAVLPKVPDTITDLDVSGHTSDAHDFDGADTHSLVDQSSMYVLTHPGPNNAFTQDVVEKTAWPMRDNPRPQYPGELQRRGIEGSFVVQFVVDSTGRVDAKTLSFPSDAQPMFLRAVKDALLRSRYLPAELAGTRVRQLVMQQFSFVIVR
jgi:TonB family protein